MDLQDFLLGPRSPHSKRFIYAIYNEIQKMSQQEATERLRQIDKAILEKALAVVDNLMNMLSTRIYYLNNIVSSAIDTIQNDMSLRHHGQSQLRSIVHLSWTLQVLKSNCMPWNYLNATELFLLSNIEHLEKLLFIVAKTPSPVWLIHGFISLPISTFQFTS